MALILLSADLSQTPDKEISTESIQKGGGATSETGKSPGIGPPGSQPRGWSGSFGWTSNQMTALQEQLLCLYRWVEE